MAEAMVDAILVHNMSRGGHLHFADEPVQLPKKDANDLLRRGAVRKPTAEEKKALQRQREGEMRDDPDEEETDTDDEEETGEE